MSQEQAMSILADIVKTPKGWFFMSACGLAGGAMYWRADWSDVEFFGLLGFSLVCMIISAVFSWKAGASANKLAIMELDLKAREGFRSDKTFYDWRDK